MITAKIYRDKYNYIRRYSISGHAAYDEHGKDIVCSAISVLGQTTLLSLVEVCGIKESEIQYSVDEETGYLNVILPNIIEASRLENTQIVLKTLVLGIESIIENYPGYINLKYRRCRDD